MVDESIAHHLVSKPCSPEVFFAGQTAVDVRQVSRTGAGPSPFEHHPALGDQAADQRSPVLRWPPVWLEVDSSSTAVKSLLMALSAQQLAKDAESTSRVHHAHQLPERECDRRVEADARVQLGRPGDA